MNTEEKTIDICDEPQVSAMCRQALLTYLPRLIGDKLPYMACVSWDSPTDIPTKYLPHILIVAPGKDGHRWPIIEKAKALGINVVVWSGDPANAERASGIGALFQEKKEGSKPLVELIVPFLK
ncbi:MAG: hypothetical protein A3B11_01260 [Candidatus Taylorbacteria bacterium RIFCSPLOWO2_01_FULL_44_26]|uniref:Uncharacterized protein n=2 Tax=Candidatus Tayloriibacteriota TaxID=1817919 RepID=A0A1G2MLM7_9BACT|nr:MAG: hypothetical protein A3D50_01040 [Candidatus Taylorbacteria bacterium RIFCSPHIGHO2_02_FULL_44_12]OHA30944.1 MAG: hypothetical protein A3B11_01260 [Candidatus Taylorbacteria bacterium RIFCSPLOWO2_01_FULL_44_26]